MHEPKHSRDARHGVVARRDTAFRVTAALLLGFSILRLFHAGLRDVRAQREPLRGIVRLERRVTEWSAAEIALVRGIGDRLARKVAARLRAHPLVSPDLRELESIPGIGPRIRARLARTLVRPSETLQPPR